MESPDKVGLLWAVLTVKLTLGFQAWYQDLRYFPKVRVSVCGLNDGLKKRTKFQQITFQRFIMSLMKNLAPDFKTKAESH